MQGYSFKCNNSPKMPIDESSSRTGFQILLKGRSFGIFLEAHSHNYFPRTKLGCVGRTAGIVIIEPFLQIICEANVALVGKGDASEKVDVFHLLPKYVV